MKAVTNLELDNKAKPQRTVRKPAGRSSVANMRAQDTDLEYIRDRLRGRGHFPLGGALLRPQGSMQRRS
jgi:hypothetical protein